MPEVQPYTTLISVGARRGSTIPAHRPLGLASNFWQMSPLMQLLPINDKKRGESTYDCVDSSGTVPSNIVIELPSGTRGETRCFDRTLSPLSRHSPINDHYMRTPFTAISSVLQASRWQKRSSQYKDDHVQQTKGAQTMESRRGQTAYNFSAT